MLVLADTTRVVSTQQVQTTVLIHLVTQSSYVQTVPVHSVTCPGSMTATAIVEMVPMKDTT